MHTRSEPTWEQQQALLSKRLDEMRYAFDAQRRSFQQSRHLEVIDFDTGGGVGSGSEFVVINSARTQPGFYKAYIITPNNSVFDSSEGDFELADIGTITLEEVTVYNPFELFIDCPDHPLTNGLNDLLYYEATDTGGIDLAEDNVRVLRLISGIALHLGCINQYS